jgi:hypothetical protein
VIPLLKRGGKTLLKQGLKSGLRVAQDVVEGKNIKSAFKNRAREAGNTLFNKMINSARPTPPGKRIKHHNRSASPQKKRRRKSGKSSDIFG